MEVTWVVWPFSQVIQNALIIQALGLRSFIANQDEESFVVEKEDSCIIRLFSSYCALSEEDRRLLHRLEESPIETRAGQVLWKECDKASEFCTISKGWAYSFRNMDDGSRQILELFLPGDIIGMREFAFSQRLTGLAMIDDGMVCHFPHRHLVDLFSTSTTLTAVLFAIVSRHQALLTERLVNLARRSAQQRLAHFIYEIYERLNQTGSFNGGHFRLPLSQEQIGDALGLSSVHVSRTFTSFRKQQLVLRERHRVYLPNPQALAEVADFDNRYLNDSLKAILGENGKLERQSESSNAATK
ncbi:Crp/Fnr family transcriptional regulator [Halomonas sp. M20]|uniref:Crp/Fnr family transcriptional regulator n=1 Tax=Halomonas sp. M20 TaxID=2763264 RepID=UPI0029CAC295|nr:Crp/Fnr family transcriptional regulator [Halomonas sp. M20]